MKLTAAQLEDEAVLQLSEVTYGGLLFLNGKEVAVTPGAMAQDIYKEYHWIKEQASEYLEDRGNFLQS